MARHAPDQADSPDRDSRVRDCGAGDYFWSIRNLTRLAQLILVATTLVVVVTFLPDAWRNPIMAAPEGGEELARQGATQVLRTTTALTTVYRYVPFAVMNSVQQRLQPSDSVAGCLASAPALREWIEDSETTRQLVAQFGPFVQICEAQSGLPFRAVSSLCVSDSQGRLISVLRGCEPFPAGTAILHRRAESTILGTRVLWAGAIGDVLVWSAFVYVIWVCWLFARSRWRMRNQQCPNCGYPVGRSASCPECGDRT